MNSCSAGIKHGSVSAEVVTSQDVPYVCVQKTVGDRAGWDASQLYEAHCGPSTSLVMYRVSPF